MKRLMIGSLVLAAVAAPLMTMSSQGASAVQVKMAKPPKLAPAAVTGGNPYPIGLGIAGANYGHLLVFVDRPALPEAAGHIDSITVTCTPTYKLAQTATDFPTAANVTTFTNISADYTTATAPSGAALSYVDTPAGLVSSPTNPTGIPAGKRIALLTTAYSDPATSADGAQYPPQACKLTTGSDPALHPTKFLPGPAMTAEGKAPKIPSSPAIDCDPLTDDGTGVVPGVPFAPVVVAPEIDPGKSTTYHMTVGLTLGTTQLGVFCSTNTSFRAKFLTEQPVKISATPKIKYKAAKGATPALRSATAKKVGLTSAVNSSITLTISRAIVTYSYDPTRLSSVSANCVTKAAKNPGTSVVPGFGTVTGNKCVINQAAGTITLISNDTQIVKPGKAIVSAPSDIAFTYTPGTDTSISLVSAQTYIGIAGATVLVNLQTAGSYFDLASDPNIGAPAITFSGLL